MKKLLGFLVLASVLVSNVVLAEKVTVDSSILTTDQKATIETRNKIEAVSGWAGIGKEVGEAVSSSLAAVTTQAEAFGKTEVGIFTMALVAWKVVGKDLLGFLIGIPFLLLSICLFVWSYRRRILGVRILVEDQGWFKPKKYAMQPPLSDRDTQIEAFLHFVCLLILVGVSALIMFAG